MNYRLNLSQTMIDKKIHIAFQSSLLGPFRSDAFKCFLSFLPAVDLADGTDEYEAEMMLLSKKSMAKSSTLSSKLDMKAKKTLGCHGRTYEATERPTRVLKPL